MEITNLNIKLPSVNLNDSESKLAEITNKSNAKSDKNFKKVLDNKISSTMCSEPNCENEISTHEELGILGQ